MILTFLSQRLFCSISWCGTLAIIQQTNRQKGKCVRKLSDSLQYSSSTLTPQDHGESCGRIPISHFSFAFTQTNHSKNTGLQSPHITSFRESWGGFWRDWWRNREKSPYLLVCLFSWWVHFKLYLLMLWVHTDRLRSSL